ncbi:MAG: glycoside hydrolase family 3, partial [Chlorobiaceae bacterium]|nr:glycoside hydrolase family 3 [Chlorobiaceae bacterium]
MKKLIIPLLLTFILMIPQLVSASEKNDSLSIKTGQMLMIGFRGFSTTEAPGIADDIRIRHVGGVVLFDYDVPLHLPSRNISSPEQLSRLTRELQKLAEIPLLIAIDQEGGKVNRLKQARGFPPSISAAHIGELDNADTTRAAALQTARTLKAMHIGMNFAPVADVNV